MILRVYAGVALVLGFGWATGCAPGIHTNTPSSVEPTPQPPESSAYEAEVRLRARDARLTGLTPERWRATDGRFIATDLLYYHRQTHTLKRRFTFEADFVVRFEGSESSPALQCSTRPRDGEPPSRLVCWSTSDGDADVVYRMAANEPRCEEHRLATTQPQPQHRPCLQGTFTTPNGRYDVVSPVGGPASLRWYDQRGQVAQTSRIATDWMDADVFVRARAALGDDSNVLLLNAVAIHVWADMLRGGRWAQGEAENAICRKSPGASRQCFRWAI